MADNLSQAGFGGGGQKLAGPGGERIAGAADAGFGGGMGASATAALVQPNIARISGPPRGSRDQLTPDQVLAPYSALADAVGVGQKVLDAAAQPINAADGAKAVTRDDQGNLKVGWRWEFTSGDRVYNAAARQAGLADGRVRIGEDMVRARQQYVDDPAGFQEWAKAYASEQGKRNDPLLAPFLKIEADEQSLQHWRGLVGEKRGRDLQKLTATLGIEEQALEKQLETIAFSGGADTPEFHASRLRLEDLRGQKASNPMIAYTPRMKELADGETNFRIKAQASAGQARRYYKESGDLQGALKMTEDAIMAEDGPLSPNERLRMIGVVKQHVLGAADAARVQKAELGDRAREIDLRLQRGDVVEDSEIRDVTGQMRGLRMIREAQSIERTVAARRGAMGVVQARSADEAIAALNGAPRAYGTVSPDEAARVYGGVRDDIPVSPGRRFVPPQNAENLPAGMRNNNPGNIKFVPGLRYDGVLGPSRNTDQGDPQAVFATPEQGMAAAYQLALKKYAGGKVTANQLIAGNMGWTPGNFAAARNIARAAGLGPDDDLNLTDPAAAKRFLRGLVQQEHGESSRLYSDQMIAAAVTGQASTGSGGGPRRDLTAARGAAGDTLAEFFRRSGGEALDRQQSAWVSAFADAVLSPNPAADFSTIGAATSAPIKGDVVVLRDGRTGFVSDGTEDKVVALIARSDGKVEERDIPMTEVSGFRTPPAAGTPVGGVTVGEGARRFTQTGDVVSFATTDTVGLTARRAAQKEFDARATEYWSVMKTGLDRGLAPTADETSEIAKMIPFISDAGKRRDIAVALSAFTARREAEGLPLPELEAVVSALEQKGREGRLDAAAREHLLEVNKSLSSRRKALEDNPYSAAVGLGFDPVMDGAATLAARMPDFSDARQVAEVFAARGRVSKMLETHDGISPRSLIMDRELDQFVGAIGRADAQGVRTMFAALMSARPENLAATLDNGKVRDALTNASLSRDPAKFDAAMGGLDALYRADSSRFIDRFGDETAQRVQNWQAFRDYLTPEEVVKQVNNPLDGLTGDALRRVEQDGRTKFRDLMTPDKVRGVFSGLVSTPGFPNDENVPGGVARVQDRLMSDFEALFVSRFRATRDQKLALSQATDLIKTRWGASDAGGGAIMQHPPERQRGYEPINGDQGWMGRQLRADLGKSLVESGAVVVPDDASETYDPMRSVRYQLVANRATSADIAGGKPPGYLVITTLNGVSQLVQDASGQPMVYRFDRDKAVAEAQVRMQERHAKAKQSARSWKDRLDALIPSRTGDGVAGGDALQRRMDALTGLETRDFGGM